MPKMIQYDKKNMIAVKPGETEAQAKERFRKRLARENNNTAEIRENEALRKHIKEKRPSVIDVAAQKWALQRRQKARRAKTEK
jgi:hypothetical protein